MAVFWIIDDEWQEYETEIRILRTAYPDCEIHVSGIPFDEDLPVWGEKADIVLAQISARIDACVISKLTNCRGIAIFGSGYDNVDILAAGAAGIQVTNVNGYCAEDIAEYVMSMILWDNKRLQQFSKKIKGGKWGANAVEDPIHRISHRTLLLLGFGHIGQIVSRYAKAIGMHVLVYDSNAAIQKVAAYGVELTTLDNGLSHADYVSVHLPLNEYTTEMINNDFLHKMKSESLLINTSRGALICEDDLVHAVKSGTIRGAVLDVCCREPLPIESVLLHTPGILVTPHISYVSEESLTELRERTAKNALAMYRREVPPDLVRK